ncbi:hypothetical protein VNO77_08142 [Canavalia gladiata]|uniref:Uncharacterized protein n=1 Tax=Canavalia gladiata TaxID=3824 RepID=A0AAN9MDQ2_CANGL
MWEFFSIFTNSHAKRLGSHAYGHYSRIPQTTYWKAMHPWLGKRKLMSWDVEAEAGTCKIMLVARRSRIKAMIIRSHEEGVFRCHAQAVVSGATTRKITRPTQARYFNKEPNPFTMKGSINQAPFNIIASNASMHKKSGQMVSTLSIRFRDCVRIPPATIRFFIKAPLITKQRSCVLSQGTLQVGYAARRTWAYLA